MLSIAVCLALMAAPAPTPGDVVATLHGKPILRAEAPDGRSLFPRIFGALLEDFARDQKIAITDEEIENYAQAVEADMEKARAEWRADIARLELERPKASPERQKQIDEEIAMHRRTLESDAKAHEFVRSLPRSEIERSNREVYGSTLRQYRINQALYRKYGGRVIFQQFGPEPLDAYRALLRDAEEKGTFKIVDASYREQFFEYFDDRIHTFTDDEKEKRRLMTTDWWLEQRE